MPPGVGEQGQAARQCRADDLDDEHADGQQQHHGQAERRPIRTAAGC
jgi:hypothetical protein